MPRTLRHAPRASPHTIPTPLLLLEAPASTWAPPKCTRPGPSILLHHANAPNSTHASPALPPPTPAFIESHRTRLQPHLVPNPPDLARARCLHLTDPLPMLSSAHRARARFDRTSSRAAPYFRPHYAG
ncbi:hypothetical protein B0H10DRAFT_2218062 [Mycena sp. CBHHK59/15]|nr:hypothetical protein B0H10DRAFT_2218062 [Mycena sp. CBHHK59/15]